MTKMKKNEVDHEEGTNKKTEIDRSRKKGRERDRKRGGVRQ